MPYPKIAEDYLDVKVCKKPDGYSVMYGIKDPGDKAPSIFYGGKKTFDELIQVLRDCFGEDSS